jgi:hypothetical protein
MTIGVWIYGSWRCFTETSIGLPEVAAKDRLITISDRYISVR